MRELVHVRLSGEMVRRGSQRAVRALAKGRPGRVDRRRLVRYIVGRVNPCTTGVVVVKLPGRQRPVASSSALDVDDAGGAKVCPGELFLARPHKLDRLAGGAGEACGLDGHLAGMLAAIAGAGVGHDHAHRAFGEPECLDQLAAHAEGPLGTSPHGQLAVFPLGDGRARLERGVGDVGDCVGLFESHVGRVHSGLDRAGGGGRAAASSAPLAVAAAAAAVRLPQVVKESLGRNRCAGRPFRMNRLERRALRSVRRQRPRRRSHHRARP